MSFAITWYDNAAFKVVYDKKIFWFDPSINKNPDSPIKTSDLKERAEFVFTTHGDPGHFVNSVEVAKRTGALFLAPEEVCEYVLDQKQLEKERVISLSFGENRITDQLKVFVFEAIHPEQSEESLKGMAQWGGGLLTRNAGFIVKFGHFTLCHIGDAVFSEVFQRIGPQFSIHVGMIPIQGRKKYTEPEEAVQSSARIIANLKPSYLFPVIQFTKEKNLVEPLKHRLAELQIQTRMLFDKPGIEHLIPGY